MNQPPGFRNHQYQVLSSTSGSFPAQQLGLFLNPIFPRIQLHFIHELQDSCQEAVMLLLLLTCLVAKFQPLFHLASQGTGLPPFFGYSTNLLFRFGFASFSKHLKTLAPLFSPYLQCFSGHGYDFSWLSVFLPLRDNAP